MSKRFTTIGVALALAAAGPFFTAAAAPTATVRLAEDIIIEPEPEVRIIEPEPEVRVEIKSPGHYERQRVLTREGHFESYDVWVPKYRKGFMNLKKVPGHYEMRQRWVPDTFEYRDVWVPHR